MTTVAGSGSPDLEALIDKAWGLTYVEGRLAGEIGEQVLRLTVPGSLDPLRAFGAFHVAFAELRSGRIASALVAAAEAGRIFDACGDRRGQLLCLELEALHARAEDRLLDAMAIHERIARDGADVMREPIDLYICLNSRAITRKLLGQRQETLLDFYRAREHATNVTGSRGPYINSLVNIGSCHSDLFNLGDARAICEEALTLAEAAGAWTAVGLAAYNLIEICEGMHDGPRALAVARLLIELEPRLPPSHFKQNAPYLALAFLEVGDTAEAAHWLDKFATALLLDGDGKGIWVRAKAQHLLATDCAVEARRVAEARIEECRTLGITDQPYGRMKLLHVATDACEAMGDAVSALAYLRQAQAVYVELVGMGAAARSVAVQTQHDLQLAERDRDRARRAHEAAERDRQVLARLNSILEEKIAESTLLQIRLHEQAMRDPLTGLHNRRFLLDAGADRVELARRQGSPVAVALLDIDFFKRVNDNHGHDVGDELLTTFAQLLRDRARRTDIVCRYGGEEFVVVASDTTPAEIGVLLRELLASLSATRIALDSGVLAGVTFSAGVAGFAEDGTTLEQLLKVADQRLYAAKDAGRARIHAGAMA